MILRYTIQPGDGVIQNHFCLFPRNFSSQLFHRRTKQSIPQSLQKRKEIEMNTKRKKSYLPGQEVIKYASSLFCEVAPLHYWENFLDKDVPTGASLCHNFCSLRGR
jgi:hypothetical protein